MTGLPLQKRPHDVFVSYSHRDGKIVGRLMKWLREDAGLRVWWDESRLLAGDRLSSALAEGVESARAALFCVSQSWVQSTWCEDEFNAALQERRADRRYRVIAIRLDDTEVPKFLANARYLEMQEFTVDAATALLLALVWEMPPWTHTDRDVYFSYSWRAAESAPADRVREKLIRPRGYRLIGDSPDHPDQTERRLARIVGSCGALVAVLPCREGPPPGFTSEGILKEALLAQGLGIPYLLLSDDGVNVPDHLSGAAVGNRVFRAPMPPDDRELDMAFDRLEETYQKPASPAFSFVAASLQADPHGADLMVNLIEQVTCMPCQIGERLEKQQHAQREIVERIQTAQFVLADVTDDHRNSIIEAGIARGAGTRLHLMCRVPESGDLRTRFMFRDLEMNWYRDAVQRIGVAHRVARLYRRRVYGLPDSRAR